jgi:hypothetical protein
MAAHSRRGAADPNLWEVMVEARDSTSSAAARRHGYDGEIDDDDDDDHARTLTKIIDTRHRPTTPRTSRSTTHTDAPATGVISSVPAIAAHLRRHRRPTRRQRPRSVDRSSDPLLLLSGKRGPCAHVRSPSCDQVNKPVYRLPLHRELRLIHAPMPRETGSVGNDRSAACGYPYRGIGTDAVPHSCHIGRHARDTSGQPRSMAATTKRAVHLGKQVNDLVEVSGLEPPTSTLRTWRSSN